MEENKKYENGISLGLDGNMEIIKLIIDTSNLSNDPNVSVLDAEKKTESRFYHQMKSQKQRSKD
jgi:hypothetical protein